MGAWLAGLVGGSWRSRVKLTETRRSKLELNLVRLGRQNPHVKAVAKKLGISVLRTCEFSVAVQIHVCVCVCACMCVGMCACVRLSQ